MKISNNIINPIHNHSTFHRVFFEDLTARNDSFKNGGIDDAKQSALIDREYNRKPALVTSIPGKILQIATGRHHSVFLTFYKGENHVFTVGRNIEGGLGKYDEKISGNVSQPIHITFFVEKNLKVVYVVCGSIHSVFLLDKKGGYACGYNSSGQCGSGLSKSPLKSLTKMKTNERFIGGCAGWGYTGLLSASRKEVFACGSIGSCTNFPSKVISERNFTANSAIEIMRGGEDFIICKTFLGEVLSVGSNYYSQLLFSNLKNSKELRSISSYINECGSNHILYGKKIVDVGVGKDFVVYVDENGYAYGVGNNREKVFHSNLNGKVGLHRIDCKEKIERARCSAFCMFLFSRKGNVFCKGKNSNGQLALGHRDNVEKLAFCENLRGISKSGKSIEMDWIKRENFIDLIIYSNVY